MFVDFIIFYLSLFRLEKTFFFNSQYLQTKVSQLMPLFTIELRYNLLQFEVCTNFKQLLQVNLYKQQNKFKVYIAANWQNVKCIFIQWNEVENSWSPLLQTI